VDLARYSAELQGGLAINKPVAPHCGRADRGYPPAFVRGRLADARFEMEALDQPDIVYRDVTGINDFGRFIRFDQDDTLTDTNEFEYGITNRLFRKKIRWHHAGAADLARHAKILFRSHLRRRAYSRPAECFRSAG